MRDRDYSDEPPEGVRRALRKSALCVIFARWVRGPGAPAPRPDLAGRLESTLDALRRLSEAVRSDGAELKVAFFPPGAGLGTDPVEIRRRVGELCGKEGIPFTDLTDPLGEAAAGGTALYLSGEPAIPNASGHRLIAEKLLGFTAYSGST